MIHVFSIITYQSASIKILSFQKLYQVGSELGNQMKPEVSGFEKNANDI